MARKSIVVVMNCQGRELIRYLRSSFSLSCQYEITYVSNILAADDREAEARVLGLLATADVVIAQDASSVPWLRNDFIAQVIPKRCRFFRLCFWRFYGYWPLPAERFHPQMWYVGDEVPAAADARAYLQTDVRPAVINANFEEQIEKFALVERKSELKMLPFFTENYMRHKLFTDEWHPTSMFVLEVARYILAELALPADVALLPEDGEDNFRHRLVLDAVSEELGLDYDQSLIKYYQTETDRETFFEYGRFAGGNYDRTTPWGRPNDSFREWCYVRGIDDAPREISVLGRVDPPGGLGAPSRAEADAGSAREGASKRRLAGAARSGSVGRSPGPGSPARPAAAPDVLWAIDLRAYREVRSVELRCRNPGPEADTSVAVLSSTDGRDWRELTVLSDPTGAGARMPLTLAFREPVLCRHIRVEARGAARLEVEGAEVYTNVVSLGSPVAAPG